MITSVVILGTGNVAWHLAGKLSAAEIRTTVFGRSNADRNEFSGMPHVNYALVEDGIRDDATIYLLCVNDDSISEVAEKINLDSSNNQVMAHTSGTAASSVLGDKCRNRGTFWPVQTLKRKVETKCGTIPVVITAETMMAQTWLIALAQRIHSPFTITNDATKRKLHLAAVIANNFTNHLLALTHQYCKAEEADFNILRPLILETVLKSQDLDPGIVQTGPAVRGDEKTMQAHMELLEDHPELAELYRMMSNSILKMYHEDNWRI